MKAIFFSVIAGTNIIARGGKKGKIKMFLERSVVEVDHCHHDIQCYQGQSPKEFSVLTV